MVAATAGEDNGRSGLVMRGSPPVLTSGTLGLVTSTPWPPGTGGPEAVPCKLCRAGRAVEAVLRSGSRSVTPDRIKCWR